KVRRRPHLEVVPSRSADPPTAASHQNGPGQPGNPSASPQSTTSPSPPLEERAGPPSEVLLTKEGERRSLDVPSINSMAPSAPDSIPAQSPSNLQPPDQEHCPHCKAPVSPRQPNGLRPELSCQHCFNP